MTHPALFFSQLFSVVVDLFFPLTLAALVRRRLGVEWRFFLYGMLVFLLFQLMTRMRLVAFFQPRLAHGFQGSPAFRLEWILILSVTAGLFEEIGRYLGYRFLFGSQAKTWDRAVMYGLGHAALESIAVVGIPALLATVGLVTVLRGNEEALRSIPWWGPALNGFERICATAIQVSLSVVVLRCFLRDSRRWLWLAIGYHALVDLTSVLAGDRFGAVGAELLIAGWAVVALGLIFRLRSDSSASRGLTSELRALDSSVADF